MSAVNVTLDSAESWKQAVPSEYERRCMLLWSIVITVVSVVGNTTVLFASIRYNAIKLDKISLVLIKNLAVADLGFTFTVLLTTGSILLKEYPYSSGVCMAADYAAYLFSGLDVLLICALNINKLTTLVFPLHARLATARAGYGIAAGMWALALLVIAVCGFTGDIVTQQVPSTFFCQNETGSEVGYAVFFVAIMVIRILPSLVIMATTISLLCRLHQARGLQKQGVFTILIVSTVFLIASLPYALYFILKNVLTPAELEATWFIVFYRFAKYLLYLNFAANPLIYYVSVKSFKDFIRATVGRVVKRVPKKTVKVTPRTQSCNF